MLNKQQLEWLVRQQQLQQIREERVLLELAKKEFLEEVKFKSENPGKPSLFKRINSSKTPIV
jgi:hypothetical protein